MISMMSGTTHDANARWEAVRTRDRTANGRFVYAVKSTGIFCRPTCPSRRPAPQRVEFFDSADEARRAGYRPCRRCRPLEADQWVEKVRRACVSLAVADGHVSLAALGRQLQTSRYHLQRNFKAIVGLTPREYADACRLRRLRRRMRSGESVTDAMFGAGYGSTSRLYERAAPMLGMHPSTYRRGGQGTEIRYAIVQSPLGWLLVAATPFGVCAVAMGDSVSALERALAAEYPRAASVRDDAMLAKATRQVLDHLSGKLPRLDLPLDVRATAFEWQVWTALKAIPPGETRTYKEVAESIGHPRAVRAVARACAGNPVALTIPCHRVVPSAGGVGGYRWGTKRKKRLLRQEQVRRE